MIQTRYPYPNAVISYNENDLQEIHVKSKNIAIFQREIEPYLSEELNEISEQLIECRAIGTIKEILSELKEYFNDHLSECHSFYDDISGLLGLFEETTQASSFRLLLTTVSTNMCRKFHTDINDLRLLCTYIGPGTLWLPDQAINQKAIQVGRVSNNEELVTDEQHIQQVRTGDVVFLKGALYPDANPILHRSPTIEENGEKRLLLRIDTNEFLIF